MTRRLTLIVPFRDRQAHLTTFLPHLVAYFQRDKLDRSVPVRFVVVEQEQGPPFNRARLCNAGFLLTRDGGDYTCFHDVDYLPVWADYSWPARPARLIWFGAEERPITPGRPETIQHGHDWFFGGAVLFRNAQFEAVNGFSNRYWGWGYEDADLRERCLASGLGVELRDGTYLALDHDHNGVEADYRLRPLSARNRRRFAEARTGYHGAGAYREDGLNTLRFTVSKRVPLALKGQDAPIGEWITVAFPKAEAPGPADIESGQGDRYLGADRPVGPSS